MDYISEEGIAELKREKDQAYKERNLLVAALSKLYPAWLSRHDDSDTAWEDDWRNIVFIEIPTYHIQHGQLSWHIHDSELPNFAHLKMKPNIWDGHSTEEKYRRLENIQP